jgi:hypothetical protein
VSEGPELPATSLLITDLGDYTYRLTFQNSRHYVAVRATRSLLERWAAEMWAIIGAPPAPPRPYAGGTVCALPERAHPA